MFLYKYTRFDGWHIETIAIRAWNRRHAEKKLLRQITAPGDDAEDIRLEREDWELEQ